MVLHRSVFGRCLFAARKNEEAARYSGMRTDRIIIAAGHPSSLNFAVMGGVILIGVLADQQFAQRRKARLGKTQLPKIPILTGACGTQS